jgi:hypothetical protein
MCECFQIGGRFIAEDPDCPEHGTAAQIREEQMARETRSLRVRIAQAQTIEDMRELMNEMLDLIQSR